MGERARAADTDAARVGALADAFAARIAVSRSVIALADARLAVLDARGAALSAETARRRRPLLDLVAALQLQARRPAVAAILSPASLGAQVRTRALLAALLPRVRAQLAILEDDRRRLAALQREATVERARATAAQRRLFAEQDALHRLQLARRSASAGLFAQALSAQDQALALDADGRDLNAAVTRASAESVLAADLATVPPPAARNDAPVARGLYRTPPGRVLLGFGEPVDGRPFPGLRLRATRPIVAAPVAGRVVFSGPFRGYGNLVILDHGSGWTTLASRLAPPLAPVGTRLAPGEALGRAPVDRVIDLELRRGNRPVAIAPLAG